MRLRWHRVDNIAERPQPLHEQRRREHRDCQAARNCAILIYCDQQQYQLPQSQRQHPSGLTGSEAKGSTIEFGQRLEQRELKSYLLQEVSMTEYKEMSNLKSIQTTSDSIRFEPHNPNTGIYGIAATSKPAIVVDEGPFAICHPP